MSKSTAPKLPYSCYDDYARNSRNLGKSDVMSGIGMAASSRESHTMAGM